MRLGASVRIAVDVGGTFTDCVLVDDAGLRLVTKALTTPADPGDGVVECLRLAARDLETDVSTVLARTSGFVHGTTAGTNALVERRGARTGLLMTRGHEETVTIGRVQQKVAGLSEREKTHLTHLRKADPPIVQPQDIRPVTERVDQDGDVIVALDEEEAAAAIDSLTASGVESIAVCLLWSFMNPAHENRLKDLVERRHPEVFVTISSEVAPVLGEYERAVSTVLNAYIGPRVSGYLRSLEGRLVEMGMPCSLLIMQANGGLGTVDELSARPIMTIDSGPAGGVLGTRFAAEQVDEQHAICADVGGTTFDVGLVFNERVQNDPAPVVDQYAYAVPKVYVKSIGAGGGSIAWIDQAGSLRVGPQSAGSDPGPACYGRGGTAATVTDAHLVLGYLDEAFPLGGHVKLDRARAEDALSRVGTGLDMTASATAAAVSAISSAQMADLTRKVTVERGLDPRQFAVFAYGGAGPVFAPFLARQVGSLVAYVPRESGVFSAAGMLATDLLFEEERSALKRSPLSGADVTDVNKILIALQRRVVARFERERVDPAQLHVVRSADMRFRMQVHELEIELPAADLTGGDVGPLESTFVTTYERTYGENSAYTDAGMEYVTFRVRGTLPLERPPLLHRSASQPGDSVIGTRPVWFEGGYTNATIHAGDKLIAGQTLTGPVVIQRLVDTVVVPPGAQADIDSAGTICISWSR